MSREDFEVISVLGPLGSGKTTTLNRLIEHVPRADSYAVVVNDVGQNNIDARRIWDHPANRSEKIIPLTAGCIGCSDVTQFREALELVHDSGVNVLFIEPTGIAPGTEIADVVRSSGFDLSILTLTNAQTVRRDLQWQVLPSQLAVADIVGITHIPDEKDEAEVMASVLEELPPLSDDVAVELIKPGSTDYFEVLTKLRGTDRELRLGRHVLEVCGCGHEHHEGHDHGERSHGVSAKSLKLKEEVAIEHIEQLLRPLVDNDANPLLRAKGTVRGMHFDLVGNEWNVSSDDTTRSSTMNVIFGGDIPESFLRTVHEFTEPVERTVVAGDKKAIVKSISDMPISDRESIVLERVSQYPAPVSPLHGELIPDCEADEGYEIAFWGNQDDMPDTSKRLAMKSYIRFRLAGLHELQHHPEGIANVDSKRAYWLRRYGATLGYNGYYLADYIEEQHMTEIREYNPATLLLCGLLATTELAFDEGRAEEKPEFVKAVLQSALQQGHVLPDEVIALRQHVLQLSSTNDQFHERWVSAMNELLSLDG